MLLMSVVLSACASNSNSASGGVLVIGRGGDSVALDGAIVTDGESAKVIHQITETLLKYKEGTTEVIPGLADLPEVSADGLKYTFKLHKGIKFHDGTDFNADAVVFNFNRWQNPKGEFNYLDASAEESFAYYDSMFGDEGNRVIKEVKALDELTVEFTLEKPQAPFLQNIAMTFFGIGSPTAIKEKKEKYKEAPVGTGPYKLVEWKRNESITLERNKDYYVQGVPKMDKLIIRSIPDNSARLNELKAGTIALMEDVNPSDLATIEGDANLQKILRPSFNVGYVGFNTKHKPFDNPKVRQALNYVVDKNAIIKAFYQDLAIPAVNPMPPSILGYNDKVEDYPYDLDKAKKLMAEAGYPNGYDKELVFYAMPVSRPYMPEGKKVAEALQAEFAKIGIKTRIESPEWAVYLKDAQKGDKDDIFMLGWTGDNGDPDNFLYTLLDKDTIGSNNYSFYINEELHTILSRAQSEPDQDKRAVDYKKAQEIIKADAPWIPLVHSTPLLAAKKGLKGFVPSPTGSETYANITLD
ncbi:ABC transporter substrate-binding protein [Paenibacillus albiflavus]|uniref:ABC transporter substrate-binding protein n=1 Tax=Paenibacillus albiflavus TaxID=2545760 RepID=A0A4R4EFW3_9BACL|nr:ABC transporter substrate-binding protein [Paenibacillus albiflavus]